MRIVTNLILYLRPFDFCAIFVEQIALLFFAVTIFANESGFLAIGVGTDNKPGLAVDALRLKRFKLGGHSGLGIITNNKLLIRKFERHLNL